MIFHILYIYKGSIQFDFFLVFFKILVEGTVFATSIEFVRFLFSMDFEMFFNLWQLMEAYHILYICRFSFQCELFNVL